MILAISNGFYIYFLLIIYDVNHFIRFKFDKIIKIAASN